MWGRRKEASGTPIVTGLSPGSRASGVDPRQPQGPLPNGSWDPGRQRGNAAPGFLTSAGLPHPTGLPWKLGWAVGGCRVSATLPLLGRPLSLGRMQNSPSLCHPLPSVSLCPHLLTGSRAHPPRNPGLGWNAGSFLREGGDPWGLAATPGKFREPGVWGSNMAQCRDSRGDPIWALLTATCGCGWGWGRGHQGAYFMLTGQGQACALAGPQREGRKQ